jgi:hypothetical protein
MCLFTCRDPLGLIFLYRFVEEDEEEEYDDCPDNLWFANQVGRFLLNYLLVYFP